MKIKTMLLILPFLFLGCSEEKREVIRPVQTYEISDTSQDSYIEYPAVVTSKNEGMLSFKVAGQVASIDVEVGSFVKKDDEIAKIDNRDYEVQKKVYESKSRGAKKAYEAARAVSDNAKAQFERVKVLYNEKAIAKKGYEEAEAGYKASLAKTEAMYSQYKESLQGIENSKNQDFDTVLKAPYDGYISKKFVSSGTVVGAGTPIVALASSDEKQIKINVGDRDAEFLKDSKDNFKGEFIAGSIHHKVKLAQVGQVKSLGKLTYPVTLDFEDDVKDILLDTTGVVRIYKENSKSQEVLIPAEAVFEKDGNPYVWIYEQGEVVSNKIEIISFEKDGKLAVDGIDVGKKIVVKGVHELLEHQKVKELEPFNNSNVGNVL